MSSYVPSLDPAPGGGRHDHVPYDGGARALPLHIKIVLLVPILALCAVAAGVGAMFVYYSLTFPDPLTMRAAAVSGPVIRILARDGSVLAERGATRDYMPLDLLPKRVTDAVVATEDRRFFEHVGLDPFGLARATYTNLRAGRFAEGGSTLTQQLAKNLFLSSERTLERKVEELVLALWLELKLSKSDILELYLNRVYFGGGVHGIEAAAQRYFGKSASNLSLAEAAVIAGLLKAPSKYSPSANPVQATARGRVVLGKMRDAGFITEEEEIAARGEQIRFSTAFRLAEQAGAGYAADFVMEHLPPIDAGKGAEIVVETTIDAALQRRAGEVVAKELARQGDSLAASQAAVAVLANDGAMRALIGGRSYPESQFNRAVKARRQPGSAFKPVVYLAALEAGFTPDRVVNDEPFTAAGWTPRNENGRYIGPVTVRDALAHSINTVAVRLLLEVGMKKVWATARRLGIKSELRRDASLALGTSEVSLLELTGAYNTFANGGYVHEPYAIRRVRTSTGHVLYAKVDAKFEPSFAAKHVGAMNDMLQATLVSGTGRRAALPLHPAAGKTGTSQDFRDAWFVGYTAYLTGGVWVGNDHGQAMNKVMGGSLPAEIWRQIMLAAHEGKPPRPLPDGSGAAPAASREESPVARNGSDDDAIARLARANERAASPEAPANPAAGAPHPERRIDEDFISRALTAGTLADGDNDGGEREPDAGGGPQRLIVRPPPGSMSLGRGPQ
jgi:penicillin-binding protein 1A